MAAVVAALVLSGCGGAEGSGQRPPDAGAPAPGGTTPQNPAQPGSADTTAPQSAPGSEGATPPQPGSEGSGEPAPPPGPELPAADVPLPKDAARLAEALETTSGALLDAIDDWVGNGDPGQARPPEPVVLLALHQQRVYRHLARRPDLADRTFDRLPAALARAARDNVEATSGLFSLTRPISGSAKFRVQPAEPAEVLLGHFKKAERRFGVEWEVLAAVMLVESRFGRVRSPSHAGAQGPMQFMPATWKAYGLGGDVQDPRDAVLGAANYLRASGAPRDYQRALHAYNPTQPYIDAVLLHARQIKRDPRAYYAYYNWQVYVRTTKGDRRLTGPEPLD
ncbi:hypothetical protein Misp01_46420 [Microtetraspora sp. NBRC 13810]|uniref:lytic transglycosylase domain-containing protein n=1 Tax=Microtetraspora sp. NBRC 13810 TaxID=3030990 RepID=UPI0024A2CDDA|nr:lytic transglycosylase domain-containing protein [Microtetraspora sp. NBRC 13810]GLW09513.1 hypothetical protein Misp01_46420 [Microtetraspora sp. NBRC 13810]